MCIHKETDSTVKMEERLMDFCVPLVLFWCYITLLLIIAVSDVPVHH